MIRWKLREVMARGKVTNRELALYTSHHETSISRLKMTDSMPRIDGEMLNNLCIALSKLFQEKNLSVIVTPTDLIEFTFDDDENPQRQEPKSKKNIAPNPKMVAISNLWDNPI
jgi:putative transcriptional regulator